MPHEPLVELIGGAISDDQPGRNFVESLKRYYHLPVNDELELLQGLEAAGLLEGGRRWRFAHDSFERYFAASCLLSEFETIAEWNDLSKWKGVREREQDFLGVIDFLREMANDSIKHQILNFNLPSLWKEHLKDESVL